MVSVEQEAGGAAGRVADAMAELGIHQLADELDDMARSAELAVLSRAADFVEQHFIDIALDVLKQVALLAGVALHLDEDLVDDLDRTLQADWRWG